jgi:hypothetical protein
VFDFHKEFCKMSMGIRLVFDATACGSAWRATQAMGAMPDGIGLSLEPIRSRLFRLP